MKRYPHNDLEALERVLASLPERPASWWSSTVSSAWAAISRRCPTWSPICKQYEARLMVDDAHSIGVLGGGRGTAEDFGVTEGVDLIMGTFSKSFASLGGFIAGEADVVDYIQHHARSLIFSASIPPANAAAAMAALEIMQAEPERSQRLIEIGDFMRERYRALGFNIGHSQTPIIPIIIGDDTGRCSSGRRSSTRASTPTPCSRRACRRDATAAHQLYGDAYRRAAGEGARYLRAGRQGAGRHLTLLNAERRGAESQRSSLPSL
jgi:7-keto-8-aminopelargonate synthetase-like enzyme